MSAEMNKRVVSNQKGGKADSLSCNIFIYSTPILKHQRMFAVFLAAKKTF